MARRPPSENKQSPSISLAEVLMSVDMEKLFGVKEGGWKLSLAGLNDSKHLCPKAQSCRQRCFSSFQ